MPAWSQGVSLGFSVVSMILALWPRTHLSAYRSSAPPFGATQRVSMLGLPLFWLGLLFLSYVLIQALNPAFRYVADARGWWLEPIAYNRWLPSGTETPFAKANAWRALILYGSAWLTVLAVWIGCTRRKSLQILITVLAGNAVALALLGFVQRGLNAEKIFGWWTPPAPYFVASFIYKNHAGAYFNLMLSLCAGLAYWHYTRGQRRLDKSTPGGLFFFFAAILSLIVLFSYSRMATLLMVGFQIVAFAFFLGRELLWAPVDHRRPVAAGVLITGVAAFIALGIYTVRNESIYARMQVLVSESVPDSISGRQQAASATWAMVQDQPLTGWGAGSFRFHFPQYQREFPAIYEKGRLFWEHAHNDYLELLAELGLIGGSVLVIGFLLAVITLVRTRFWTKPLSVLIFAGLLQTLAHSWVDFNFYNPAILITWCTLWVVLIRWTKREESASKAVGE